MGYLSERHGSSAFAVGTLNANVAKTDWAGRAVAVLRFGWLRWLLQSTVAQAVALVHRLMHRLMHRL